MTSADEQLGRAAFLFVLSFVISLVRIYPLLGQAWAGGKGELATCRHRADSGRKLEKNVRCHRLNASTIKQKATRKEEQVDVAGRGFVLAQATADTG